MLVDVNKRFVFCLLTTLGNVLPLHLKQTFLPIIWIFNEDEDDMIESRLAFRILSTLIGNDSNKFSAPYIAITLFEKRFGVVFFSNARIKVWKLALNIVVVEVWTFVFFLIFSWKKIRSQKSTTHFYWALNLYLFWVKVGTLITWRCLKCTIWLQYFFSWKLKENKDSKFDKNSKIRRYFQHFEYDMICT